jgi:hypothetical protein
MNYGARILALALLATISQADPASADFWARVDHPWSNEELDQAIGFCRMQPRVSPDVKLFIDMIMGKEIDRCMHALGWIRVAR